MKISLKQMFESHKDELSKKLNGLTIPSDEKQIIAIVNDYLNGVCDSDGEFRQNLTQAEDYIFQAAMSLLNAQKAMADSIRFSHSAGSSEAAENSKNSDSISYAGKEKSSILAKFPSVSSESALIGVGVGSLAGKLVLGGWGAVFGAIAGTAVAIYVATQSPDNSVKKSLDKGNETKPSIPIDTDIFINTLSALCFSVDNLLDTFRAQVNNVVEKYESQPKPTLDTNYRILLESIQTLVGYERTHSENEEKYVKKLKERIEDVSEVLENWNLQFVDYDGNNSAFFEKIPSEKTTEEKMVYPAIVKDSSTVLKGKVFIPQE